MTYKGRVQNGAIVLDQPLDLPDGTEVDIVSSDQAVRPIADVLRNVIGKATGLPSDASAQHDHYIYGTPKR